MVIKKINTKILLLLIIVFISATCNLIGKKNYLIGKEIGMFLNKLEGAKGKLFVLSSLKKISKKDVNILMASSGDCPSCVFKFLKDVLKKLPVQLCIFGFVNDSEKHIIISLPWGKKIYFDRNNKIIEYLKIRKTPMIIKIDKTGKVLKIIQIISKNR